MATKNRRVAAYLPPHVDEKFQEYKKEVGIQGDSEAFIKIVMEHLGVDHSVSHKVSFTQYSDLVERVESLEDAGLVTQQDLSALKAEMVKEIALAIAKGSSLSESQGEMNSEHPGQMSLIPPEQPSAPKKAVLSDDVIDDIPSDIPYELLKGLSATKLGKRLGLDRKRLPALYRQGVLPQESQKSDPDNIAWTFDETDGKCGKYYPVDSKGNNPVYNDSPD